MNRKYDLILRRIEAALQHVASGRGIKVDTRIVSGRDELGAKSLGSACQRCELQIAIAVNTWNRRAARRILADEIGDDRIGELALEIHDVVWNPEPGGDAPGIVEIVDRAARAERTRAGL